MNVLRHSNDVVSSRWKCDGNQIALNPEYAKKFIEENITNKKVISANTLKEIHAEHLILMSRADKNKVIKAIKSTNNQTKH